MRQILASPFGTFLKGFISTILTLWIAMDDLFTMDVEMYKTLLTAGVVSNLPVIINWLNPNYQGYGKKD